MLLLYHIGNSVTITSEDSFSLACFIYVGKSVFLVNVLKVL